MQNVPEALVYGASGGIGSALVRLLKTEGWRVFAAAREPERIPAEADAKLVFDTDDLAALRETSFKLAQETEGLDLVVYAAGSLRADLFAKLSTEDWSNVLSTNLTGAFAAATHSLDLMSSQGHMVFIGAYVDHLLLPKMAAYAAAKAGLEPMVEILRKEQRKLRFTIVRPGAVDTAFWEHAPFRKPDNAKSPQVVAQAILDHHLSGTLGDLNL